MAPIWVIGAGGLLGSAVVRRLRGEHLEPLLTTVRWGDPALARADLAAGVQQLANISASEVDGDVEDAPVILWCAGAGIPSSPKELFEAEIVQFQYFLDALRSGLPTDQLAGLRFFLASSAGAVYSGVGAPPYDETSPVIPLAPYGHAKLAMEDALCRFSHDTSARAVAGRISNLYGPGQHLAKAQGLVSVLLMGALTHTPVQIYVSLDTIRDYLFVNDAAALALACVDRVVSEEHGTCTIKVLCAGQGTTIGGLLGLVRNVVGRRSLIVQGASRLARSQTRDLSVRSVIWPDIDQRANVPMLDGIGRTYRDLQHRRCAGL